MFNKQTNKCSAIRYRMMIRCLCKPVSCFMTILEGFVLIALSCEQLPPARNLLLICTQNFANTSDDSAEFFFITYYTRSLIALQTGIKFKWWQSPPDSRYIGAFPSINPHQRQRFFSRQVFADSHRLQNLIYLGVLHHHNGEKEVCMYKSSFLFQTVRINRTSKVWATSACFLHVVFFCAIIVRIYLPDQVLSSLLNSLPPVFPPCHPLKMHKR